MCAPTDALCVACDLIGIWMPVTDILVRFIIGAEIAVLALRYYRRITGL